MFLSCLLVRVLPSRGFSSGQLSCSTGCKALHPLALTCQLITGHWLRQCVNEWKEVAGNELIRHLACEKPTPFADREERSEILKIQPQANPGKAPAACGSSPARPNGIGLFANVDEFGLQSHWACGVKSWRLFSRLQPQGFAPVFFSRGVTVSLSGTSRRRFRQSPSRRFSPCRWACVLSSCRHLLLRPACPFGRAARRVPSLTAKYTSATITRAILDPISPHATGDGPPQKKLYVGDL